MSGTWHSGLGYAMPLLEDSVQECRRPATEHQGRGQSSREQIEELRNRNLDNRASRFGNQTEKLRNSVPRTFLDLSLPNQKELRSCAERECVES